ncbi:hypothetical protein TNCV_4142031 [Trichonephila clavipes]|nr:hypothetical protein TNCV_4142031 [Trichonephila clavipes]
MNGERPTVFCLQNDIAALFVVLQVCPHFKAIRFHFGKGLFARAQHHTCSHNRSQILVFLLTIACCNERFFQLSRTNSVPLVARTDDRVSVGSAVNLEVDNEKSVRIDDIDYWMRTQKALHPGVPQPTTESNKRGRSTDNSQARHLPGVHPGYSTTESVVRIQRVNPTPLICSTSPIDQKRKEEMYDKKRGRKYERITWVLQVRETHVYQRQTVNPLGNDHKNTSGL